MMVAARPVLVVDDDPGSRLLVDSCLSRLGLANPRVELPDGDQAIAELRRCRAQGPDHLPVLVLLDRHPADLQGPDVLRWMRMDPSFEDVPVVVLSSDESAHAVTEAYDLGVRSYLVKPVAFQALGAVVRDLGLPWLLT